MNPPCKHIAALIDYLRENKIRIWSEHGEDPAGWVNVYCKRCDCVMEDTIDYRQIDPSEDSQEEARTDA